MARVDIFSIDCPISPLVFDFIFRILFISHLPLIVYFTMPIILFLRYFPAFSYLFHALFYFISLHCNLQLFMLTFVLFSFIIAIILNKYWVKWKLLHLFITKKLKMVYGRIYTVNTKGSSVKKSKSFIIKFLNFWFIGSEKSLKKFKNSKKYF